VRLKKPLELWQLRNSCEQGVNDEKWVEGEVAVELNEIVDSGGLESFLNVVGEKLAGEDEVLMSTDVEVVGYHGNTLYLKVTADASAMLENDEPTEECQSCGSLYLLDELTNPIPDLEQRVSAGEPMPSGECPNPECRAVCHTIKEKE
jgi:hypothetical protein